MTLPFTYPKWLPDPQQYAVEQERYRHDEALAFYGEYAIFVLMWHLEDYDAGLVQRCDTCFVAFGDIADVYKQGSKEKCPDCFGTTFDGGYKAIIVRLSLWDANEEAERDLARGEVQLATASIQSTSDFRLRTGDYIFRGDGTRWRMKTLSTNHIRTGFNMPNRVETPLGYNFGEVVMEDENTVAFMIPPDPAVQLTIDVENIRYPVDWSSIEDIRGSLT